MSSPTMPMPTPTPAPAPMAQALSSSTIIIIAAVGFAILAALLGLSYLLFRERRKHNRAMHDLENRGITHPPRPEIRLVHDDEVTRPRNVLRRSTFLPFGTRVGWDSLASREDVRESQRPPGAVVPARNFTRQSALGSTREKKNKRASVRISWPFSRSAPVVVEQPVPLEHVRLSAIVQSPAVSRTPPTVRDDSEPVPSMVNTHDFGAEYVLSKTIRCVESSQPLRPQPLAVTKKRNRAQTMDGGASLLAHHTEMKVIKRPRPAMHARSFSLGSHSPGSVPQNPAPPLPLRVLGSNSAGRPRSCVDEGISSRLSVSSLESISSSVLASPKLQRSASERSARMHNGAQRRCYSTVIMGPRPQRNKTSRKRPQSSPEHNFTLHSLRGSIRSVPESIPSGDGGMSSRPESGCTIASGLSDFLVVQSHLAQAEAVRFSRVSAVSYSPGGLGISTPRRVSRFMVTPGGSPARTPALDIKEIPAKARLSRELSQTSISSSTRSSNGNPFQFDPSPMASGKPSAMKGSPNARIKGHKRQNCVRIAISPTIINPGKRGSSPLMANIQEESPETSAKVRQKSVFSSSMGALPIPPSSPRPPSSATFAPDVKLGPTTLRASLTPSSPTLSSMRFSQEFTSHDNSNISLSSSAQGKLSKRTSVSSVGTIPLFPSPGKAASTMTSNIQPTPIFSYTRPSGELERDSSPPPKDFLLLAQPFSPTLGRHHDVSTKAGAESRCLSSADSPPERFVFPRLEKEQLKMSKPKSDAMPVLNQVPVSSSSRDWTFPLENKENLAPISPPCSPRTNVTPEMPLDQCLSSSPPERDGGVSLPLYSPSPIPGPANSTFLQPSGDTETPDSGLCLSIAQLRRMNSDANADAKNPSLRAARRYQQMGNREESPALEDERSPSSSSRDSMGSLWEIDRALDNGDDLGNLDEGDEDAVAILEGDDDVLLTDIVGLNKENEDEGDAKRKKSVWEQGERFWSRSRSSSPLPSRSATPLSVAKNSQNRNSGGVQSPLVHRRVSEMRVSGILAKLPVALSGMGTPKVVVQPPTSDIATPGSLYDENGFLK